MLRIENDPKLSRVANKIRLHAGNLDPEYMRSFAELMRHTGASRQRVLKALKQLKEAGYLVPVVDEVPIAGLVLSPEQVKSVKNFFAWLHSKECEDEINKGLDEEAEGA